MEPRFSFNTICFAVMAITLVLIFLFGANVTNS